VRSTVRNWRNINIRLQGERHARRTRVSPAPSSMRRPMRCSSRTVASEATVKLVISAVRKITQDKRNGRAEAPRRSMLVHINKGEPHEAHPAFWAPFVLVGEAEPGNDQRPLCPNRSGLVRPAGSPDPYAAGTERTSRG
jgi:hypothetical protein